MYKKTGLSKERMDTDNARLTQTKYTIQDGKYIFEYYGCRLAEKTEIKVEL